MADFLTSDGHRLHYSEKGDGLPVLCLAGLTRNERDFDYVAPHLPECRLIRLDYRGRGQSDWDKNWQNYSLPIEIRDVCELLDHLDIPQVAILGSSRGGLIAMGLAHQAPERLLGVALNDVGPVLDPAGIAAILPLIGKPPVARTLDEAAQGYSMFMAGFEDVPLDRWREEAERHFEVTPDGLALNYDPALREAVAAEEIVPDLWDWFEALKEIPTLTLRGANSTLVTAATLEEMQARNPTMIAATIDGRAHIPFLDEPQSVAALRAWLEMMQ